MPAPSKDIWSILSPAEQDIKTAIEAVGTPLKDWNIDIYRGVSNDFVANYFEEIIDGCVYELYFEEQLKEKELNILETVEQMIKPISQISDEKTKGEAIWDVFNSIKKTDNPIRTRLGLFASHSEILASIIASK